ncbi:hypothetical protein [Rickettsia typhi]|uniref:Uncharacterized protein n=2 Tax=Rickettsia typhi TaxID=785 RepID=Q68W24_RICTY|nr:hypothetical protein [Rickettsia typhi]AAU04168.1 rickettsial conserved hypothetical protein [Rickettsia typhi str. Wilmington]AFE54546.1 hypothetical protein RTTH1527_03405 [Rickettsia typhi str. TH1527]
MLKSIIYELLKSSIKQEEQSYSKTFFYFLNILGLVLIIIANYCYSSDSIKFYFLMQIGIISIISSMVIEAVRCYLKYKNRCRYLDCLRSNSRVFVGSISKTLIDLVSTKTLIRYLPTIIRYVPSTVITFLICTYIKRKFLKNFTYTR